MENGAARVAGPADGAVVWVWDLAGRTCAALPVTCRHRNDTRRRTSPRGTDVPSGVPLAATGLAVLMAGAAITHVRRKEPPMAAGNLVLLALAVSLAWGRYGPYASGA